MFDLTLDCDEQAMGRYNDAIVDCKAAIVNDPDVCIVTTSFKIHI